jgi:hypothetical protein
MTTKKSGVNHQVGVPNSELDGTWGNTHSNDQAFILICYQKFIQKAHQSDAMDKAPEQISIKGRAIADCTYSTLCSPILQRNKRNDSAMLHFRAWHLEADYATKVSSNMHTFIFLVILHNLINWTWRKFLKKQSVKKEVDNSKSEWYCTNSSW